MILNQMKSRDCSPLNKGTLRFANVEYGTIVRYGDGNIAGVFPTEQEAYEYFDLPVARKMVMEELANGQQN